MIRGGKMKNTYTSPELVIVEFSDSQVILTSAFDGGLNLLPTDNE